VRAPESPERDGGVSLALKPEARKSVFIVWLVIFLDLLGFGIVLPSLAYFVHVYTVPEIAARAGAYLGMRDVAAVFVGLIQASYSVCQLVFAPLWGRLSDRVGRRPVLSASMGGFTIAWICFAFAPSMGWLLVARLLAGAFGANISTAQAYMADTFPAEERAKGMGLIGMAFGLGFVFGPAFGALLASDTIISIFVDRSSGAFERAHVLVPALFAASFSALAFLLAVFGLKESLVDGSRAQKTASWGRELIEPFRALRDKSMGAMLIVYFMITTGFANIETMFSQYNYDVLKLPQSTNGLVFTAIGLTLAVVQGGMIGRLTARFGSAKMLSVGLIGLSTTMVAFGFQRALNPGLPTTAWLLLNSISIGVFNSFSNPSVLAIVSTLAKNTTQGGTMGLTASSGTLGRIVGPMIGGVIYASFGPEWPFAVGAAMIVVALCLFQRTRSDDDARAQQEG
jgi:MFS family permease